MTAGLSYILYGLFALGAVGLYLAMPRAEGTHRKAGAAVGACAIVGLLVLLATEYVAPNSQNVFFYLFAAVALFAAGRVVSHPQPAYSAVYFALVVLCVAVLLVIQRAEFLAAVLVIVYAGAILVTYAFVLMLAQQSGARSEDLRAREPLAAILVSFVVMGAIAGHVDESRRLPSEPPVMRVVSVGDNEASAEPVAEVHEGGNTIQVGRSLFTDYVVAVQIGGLLLLVAMVGAIAMARKQVPTDVPMPEPKPLGQIGKEVPPY